MNYNNCQTNYQSSYMNEIRNDFYHKNDYLKTLDTSSNQSNHSNFNNPNYYNLNNNINNNNFDYPKYRTNLRKSRKPKKRVRFNEDVDVVLVESYKEYNRDDEDISIGEYIDEKQNFKSNGQKRKKGTKCECNIIQCIIFKNFKGV